MSDGPTITTIAQRAGVSIASVSRVLNGLPTRARPSAAGDGRRRRARLRAELGGRSLKSRRSNQVAFAMADIGNPMYVAMMREIQPVLKAAGYRLVLHSTDADAADEIDVLRGLGERYVDGLIMSPLRVTGRHLKMFAAARAPMVIIGSVPEGTPVDNVRADSRTGCASPSTTCTRWAAGGSASSTARSTPSPAPPARPPTPRRWPRSACRTTRTWSRSATSTATRAPRGHGAACSAACPTRTR